jgi:hypothetical protein
LKNGATARRLFRRDARDFLVALRVVITHNIKYHFTI